MERYISTDILKQANTNRPYYKGKFYPDIPLSESDEYIITTVGDRLDNIAYSYYNDIQKAPSKEIIVLIKSNNTDLFNNTRRKYTKRIK